MSHLLDGEVGAVCGKLAAPVNFASPAQRTIRSRWITTGCRSGLELVDLPNPLARLETRD